jgi:hypothetical protein
MLKEEEEYMQNPSTTRLKLEQWWRNIQT